MSNLLSVSTNDEGILKWITQKNKLSLIIRAYRRKNYYEVLDLKEDCTAADIKKAFIKLSKLHHPDGNLSDTSRHSKFVEINEAYSILIKRQARIIYDEALRAKKAGYSGFGSSIHYQYPKNNNDYYQSKSRRKEEAFWEFRDKSEDKNYNHENYYGIRGIKRVPNWYFAVACGVCVLLSSTAFVFGAQVAAKLRKEEQEKVNKINMKCYEEVIKRRRENTREEQIKLLQENYDQMRSVIDGKS